MGYILIEDERIIWHFGICKYGLAGIEFVNNDL